MVALAALPQEARAASPAVAVALGKAGLSSLRYGGTEFLQNGDFRVNYVSLQKCDGTAHPADLKDGKVSVDEGQRQVTLTYGWGGVTATYKTEGDRLNVAIRVSNATDEVLAGVFLQLMEVKFPACPKGFDGNPRLAHNIGWPSVIAADYGTGVMVLCNDDVGRPLIFGYPWSIGDRKANTTCPIWAYTSRHGMLPTSLPLVDRPIYPGGSDSYRLCLRFGPAGTPVTDMADDLYKKFAAAYPFKLKWQDRRPINSLFLSSSNTGYPTNPRGWWNDKTVDVTTKEGLEKFKARLLQFADTSVAISRDMDAQGMILWDVEGQQYPHAISYLGDPRSLPPELDGVIDEFFKRFRDAGLRTGLCVRPQRPMRPAYTDWVWQIEVADPAENLISKIAEAKKRWGCTLFYVDSNGDPSLPMDASVFRRVAEAHPDVLLIPEHENLCYYAYTAPYNQLNMGVASTTAIVRHVYPGAFSVLQVADGPVDQRRAELVTAVRSGDILLFRGWFADPYNDKVKGIYREAMG